VSFSTYPSRLTTRRLVLRAPEERDRSLWVRLHRDPSLSRQSRHASEPTDAASTDAEPTDAEPTDAEAGEDFDAVLAHWHGRGFGHHVVERFGADGEPEAIGMGGLRAEGPEELVLSYRFTGPAHGEGFAREAARAWAAAGVEHLTGTVTAVAKEHNLASVRTALSAGLGRAGTRTEHDDPPGAAPSLLLRAPRIEVVRGRGFSPSTRHDVLDLWTRVTRAGGAVGFLPEEPREAHAAALEAHEEQMSAGRAIAVLLRDPDAPGDPRVAGVGWWVREQATVMSHRRTAYRVMTDPDKRGRNLGRILVAAMHRAARGEDVEIVTLGVRGGLSLEHFYERCGYREVGRLPGGIRVAPGDDRDEITMARRLT
jgi:RimJ/RimL family protein N-acetyltransferase